MISKYVNKYDNYESQYIIQTSSAYQKKVEYKKWNTPMYVRGDYLISKKDKNLLLLKKITFDDITNKILRPKKKQINN